MLGYDGVKSSPDQPTINRLWPGQTFGFTSRAPFGGPKKNDRSSSFGTNTTGMGLYIYIYVYTHIYICIHTHIYIYIYISFIGWVFDN